MAIHNRVFIMAKKVTPKTMKKTASRKHARTVSGPFSVALLPIDETPSGKSLRLRNRLGLNRETFARLVPMSTRTLASIESGKPPSANAVRQLKELKRVIDALSEVLQTEAIGLWIEQPNDAFDGLKPIEVIERGEIDRIWQMIFYLRSGIAS